jgi:hypothetical protein
LLVAHRASPRFFGAFDYNLVVAFVSEVYSALITAVGCSYFFRIVTGFPKTIVTQFNHASNDDCRFSLKKNIQSLLQGKLN